MKDNVFRKIRFSKKRVEKRPCPSNIAQEIHEIEVLRGTFSTKKKTILYQIFKMGFLSAQKELGVHILTAFDLYSIF